MPPQLQLEHPTPDGRFKNPTRVPHCKAIGDALVRAGVCHTTTRKAAKSRQPIHSQKHIANDTAYRLRGPESAQGKRQAKAEKMIGDIGLVRHHPNCSFSFLWSLAHELLFSRASVRLEILLVRVRSQACVHCQRGEGGREDNDRNRPCTQGSTRTQQRQNGGQHQG